MQIKNRYNQSDRMKKNLRYIIGISAFALVGIITIQVNWILQSAKLREAEFNHRATMALYATVNKLSDDESIAAGLEGCLSTNSIIAFNLKAEEIKKNPKIKSILKKQLEYFQIDLDFEFEIITHEKGITEQQFKKINKRFIKTPYKYSLEQITQKSGLEIRLFFPDKRQFIYTQMASMLLASLLFILLITTGLVVSILTIIKQKKMAEMTTDFINNMTHEFKTPIATISLASNMLGKGQSMKEPGKINRYNQIVKDENNKLKLQVERVLDMARIERGEIKLKKEHSDIHELIKNAINAVELQVKERDGNIECKLEAENHSTFADEIHIINVISNLLDNANKYSPEKPKITLSTRNEENHIVISVKDEGIGMKRNKQKHIFDKFYRVATGNIHNVKGFGLGLSYVKMMVDAHKGKINLISERDKGSCFEVFLPL